MFTKIHNQIKVGVTALGIALLPTASALAQSNPLTGVCTDPKLVDSEACKSAGRNTLFGPGSLFDNIIQTVIYIVGAAAVLMLVIGGLRYVLSGGDPNSTSAARSTILHAIIGVAVALSAQIILSFVLRRL